MTKQNDLAELLQGLANAAGGLSAKLENGAGSNPATAQGYMSEQEARAFMGGISRTAIWKLRKSGGLKFYRMGRRVLYDPCSIRTFVEKGAGSNA